MGSRISEEEIESERRSTPPGTIGESQDVMSENIGYSIRMLSKKQSTFNYVQKQSIPAFESKNNIDFVIQLIVIKERIPLPNDNQ